MKPLKSNTVLVLLTLVFAVFFTQDIFSQGPPPWAPAHGYRAKTRHIYFPEQNMYYDLQKGVYIYYDNGNWQVNVNLPTIFGSVNLGTTQQVQLDYCGNDPQQYNADHVSKYKPGKKAKKKPKKKKKK